MDVHRIGFSPDGNYLIAGSKIYSSHFWTLATNFKGNLMLPLSAFSPDGKTLAIVTDFGHKR